MQFRSVSVRRLAVGIALVTAVAVATPGVAAAQPKQGSSADPIKVMQITVLSGPLKYVGVEKSTKAAVKEINNNGGLGGSKLKLIVCDTAGTLTGSEDCGQQAVDEGVVAGVGCIENNDSGYLGVFEKNGLSCIGDVTGADPAAYTSKASFPIDPGAFGQLPGVVGQLAETGAKKIAMVYPPSGAQAAALAGQSLERFPGAELVNIEIPEGAPDMASYAAAATAEGIDAIYVLLFINDGINFINEVRINSADIPIGFTTTDPTLFIRRLGDAANGLLTNAAYVPPSAPQAASYRKAMKKAGYKASGGVAMNGYVAVQVFADLAEDLSEVTPEAVTAAANALAPPGLSTDLRPPIQFTEPVQTGVRIFSRCIAPMKVKKGQLVLTNKSAPFIDGVSGEECPLT